MNQRIEFTLESIVKSCAVRLHVPVELAYDDALVALGDFKAKIEEMYELAKKQHEEQQAKAAAKAEVKP
jgi:hypothetical protein